MTDSNRQKILYVITKSNLGGAQKYVYDLATALPGDRFEVAVVAGGKGPLLERLAEANVRTISIKSLKRDISIFSDLISFFELIFIFKKERPDIIHVNSSKVGGLGALAGRIAGVPQIIFTCHGWAFNEERPVWTILAIRFLSWLTVMFAHKTITVSFRDTVDGQKMLWSKGKVVMVHNGIRKPEFIERTSAQNQIKDMARKNGVEIPKNSFLIGAIGELHKNKGYEYMLRAFSIARKNRNFPYRLIIIGEGEEREKLKGLIRELDLEADVCLLGYVKDAPTFLAAFDAFTLSSIKEGLPYVIIEAGYAGLPVVATNVGGVREIIEDMKSGILVQTRKPDDIAEGLSMLAKEPEKIRVFGLNLKEKVERDFSIEKMVAKTIEVYKS
jgi:glycosyltransferase involved in cell wall biosynthesis